MAESAAVADVIENIGYLGMGSVVGDFEHDLEHFVGGGVRCLCVNSGTAALHLAVQAVTRPGDEVLVPSYTFVSCYQAITAAGCRPVSCDIDPTTLTLDLHDAERRITPRTTAMMPVYFASNIAMTDQYRDFAKAHGLRLIEDAAHAFGCTWKGQRVGATGDVVCFSFDGIKNITSGEGGAVFTKNPETIQRVSDSRLLGVMKDSEKRYVGQRSYDFDVVAQGYRYHMSNIFAAIGRVQLSRFEKEFAPKRQHVAQRYTALLKDNPHVKLTPMDYERSVVPHIFALQILYGKREKLIGLLKEHDIQYGIQYKPNHLLTYFKTDYRLPVSEEVFSRIISLPMHPELTDDDIDLIAGLVNSL